MVIKMNVPNLRFKEFNGEYQITTLKEITFMIKDGTHGTHKDVDEGIPLLSAKDIYNNKINIPTNTRKISMDDFNSIYRNYTLKKNDIMMTIVGTIGRTALYNNENVAFQRSVAAIRINEENNTQYIRNYLESNSVANQLKNMTNSSAQGGIYLGSLEKVKLLIPEKNEQNKIAKFLSLLDTKIELQSKKIEALKLYKKGLIEKIYLMDIYDKITLKNLFNSYGGTSLESYVSDKGTYNFISIGNYSMDGEYINNNQKIVLNDKTKDKLLNKNDLVMILNDKTSSGDIIGSTILIDEDNKYIYNQRSQRLVCKKEILPEYAWCYLNTSKHRRKVFSHSQGGTQIYINFSQIEKMKVLLPKDFKNQKIISTIIIDTCNKIKLNEIKMKELRKLKKGLMQNMFV